LYDERPDGDTGSERRCTHDLATDEHSHDPTLQVDTRDVHVSDATSIDGSVCCSGDGVLFLAVLT
jgi:hypothetical protein